MVTQIVYDNKEDQNFRETVTEKVVISSRSQGFFLPVTVLIWA